MRVKVLHSKDRVNKYELRIIAENEIDAYILEHWRENRKEAICGQCNGIGGTPGIVLDGGLYNES